MIIFLRTCVVLLFAMGCAARSKATIEVNSLLSAKPCAPPRIFGAIPDDGIDDRVALQSTLSACSGTIVSLEHGKYDIQTPAPRPVGMYAMLTVPVGTTLQGMGDTTVLEFSGDNTKRDWRGLQILSSSSIRRLRLVSNFSAGTTVEQTHMMRIDGPVKDIHLSYLSCHHPAPGSKSGDCFQAVCYPPAADGSRDRLCWNIEVDHVVFEHSDRSGIAIHSGLRGVIKPDGHYSTRFHHNTFLDISDQPIDGEGSGGTDTVEIDHNVFKLPRNLESAIAIQIQTSSRIYIHDNDFEGRGMDLYGCDKCIIADNTCTQTVAGGYCAQLRKAGSGTTFSDEKYTRDVSAGPGVVLNIEQKTGAPDNVSIIDSIITQHTDFPAINVRGIVGMRILGTSVVYDGVPYIPGINRIDGIILSGSGTSVSPSCTDNGIPSETPGVRTTDVVIADTVIRGPYRSAFGTSGSYCGMGTIKLMRTRAAGPFQGLRCENITAGSRISGPVTYEDNEMPTSVCSPLLP